MSAKAFVDTNVLVYAHDSLAGEKHDQAKSLVRRLWTEKAGVLSTRVLQEFYVIVRKKVLHPSDVGTARRWLSHYINWRVIENDRNAVLEAIDIELRYQLSFWDALIIQAANQAGTTLLLFRRPKSRPAVRQGACRESISGDSGAERMSFPFQGVCQNLDA